MAMNIVEIETMLSNWKDGMLSDGEILTNLAYAIGLAQQAVNQVVLDISRRETEQAERRLRVERPDLEPKIIPSRPAHQ